ncbi:hypothetical protein WJX73_000643 [Symbiochloris irregularis]|uniref:Uncharacterized protein n=1 Tax=Symbiochloris irregularis TaxID=706552 RepID=A0AAW1NLX5_9CHLO
MRQGGMVVKSEPKREVELKSSLLPAAEAAALNAVLLHKQSASRQAHRQQARHDQPSMLIGLPVADKCRKRDRHARQRATDFAWLKGTRVCTRTSDLATVCGLLLSLETQAGAIQSYSCPLRIRMLTICERLSWQDGQGTTRLHWSAKAVLAPPARVFLLP